MTAPSNLTAIRSKVRKMTGRPSTAQISDAQIDEYVNTFYVFDMPEHLRLESLRVNYQFVTNVNQPAYDFPVNLYLTAMPPVYISGYQCMMSQSRENFYRGNPRLQYMERVSTGNGTVGPYTFTLTQHPICPGWKPNPPGAYSVSVVGTTDIPASQINFNVLISGTDVNGHSVSLIDDGGSNATGHTTTGLLFDFDAASTVAAGARGTINYVTGLVTIFGAPLGFARAIAAGSPINAQYIPYVASRPQTACFFQDQVILFPLPDQAYTVSFEAYKYPTALATATSSPQLQEWWQLLALGAADKIFCDNGDMDNMAKYRPILDEQMRLVQRRTIVQYSSERVSTIYSDQTGLSLYPYGGQFGGI
jgi:hypothetical protein